MLVVTGIAALLGICRIDPLLLMLAAGAAGVAWSHRERLLHSLRSLAVIPPAILLAMPAAGGAGPGGATLTGLGLFFLKTGSILYGGGYVLVAFLQEGLVDSRGWLTQSRLLDAIAVGQFTPGPVLSTATFIGYLLFGVPGALVATGAIFMPSFLFVLAVGPFVPRLRNSPGMRGFLDGVNAGALGLMAGVCVTLGASTLGSPAGAVIAAAALFIQLRWRLNAAWIVAGGAAAGWAVGLL